MAANINRREFSSHDDRDNYLNVSLSKDSNNEPNLGNITLMIDPNVEANLNISDEIPKAFNLYRNKKLISHGMMNVALFSANASQLRYLLETGNGGAFFIICVVLLLISIILQISVGITLLLSARYNVTQSDQRAMAFKFGNYVIIGIFLITVVNVFLTSFGGPMIQPPTTIANTVSEAVTEITF
ncbi:ninjurin-A-like isoform X2 [Daktulosphaira vitifoliae]|uniref:ninjurin-A-like isoform X1 n=1 Tax=Daktulosphaira vitifoliae TaxID=58002 RepID=UPI0021A9BC02|nr:ninjurin-A-like isoform X1 [Daktulosphaira vitifoliae]XP_050524563.1 ninjurin-A-like isoform X2 [Daktulosphaira vitifoliae]